MADLKKKKVWIEIKNSDESILEMEVEVNDYDEVIIESYDDTGKIIFKEKKEKSIIDIIV